MLLEEIRSWLLRFLPYPCAWLLSRARGPQVAPVNGLAGLHGDPAQLLHPCPPVPPVGRLTPIRVGEIDGIVEGVDVGVALGGLGNKLRLGVGEN